MKKLLLIIMAIGGHCATIDQTKTRIQPIDGFSCTTVYNKLLWENPSSVQSSKIFRIDQVSSDNAFKTTESTDQNYNLLTNDYDDCVFHVMFSIRIV